MFARYVLMMRTTIHLPDDLLARLKRRAADTNRTLTAVIEEALRRALAPSRRSGKAPPARLTTFGAGGLQPGVDLDDSAALLDLLEAPGAAAGR
jgi:Arc/MetJ family transcription regulator